MSPQAATARPTVAQLRTIDLFDDLSDAQVEEWAAAAVVQEFEPGDVVAEQGADAEWFTLLLEGDMQVVQLDGERSEPVGRQEAPTWAGAIAVMTEGTFGVRMLAETRCVAARVPGRDLRRLARAQESVHRRIMRQIRPVLGRIESMGQNRERLAALGTMAAGLAHELNNPAAAARRAAAELADALDVLSSTLGHFVHSGVERAEAEQIVDFQQRVLAGAAGRTALDVLDAADAEDELVDALEDLGVTDAWRIAEPLAEAGLERAELQRIAALAGDATDAALRWIAASLTARGLTRELQDSAERMSRLVGAVKSYSHMDRGEVVEADLHEGLETTLVVLGHKLKHGSVTVVREYDRTIPKATVRGSELNQVWTNLLDNAIDAVDGSGTITIRTRRDGGCAEVEVEDDGPGIAPDALPHVFEPFFTTKEVGSGTGLGLDTARRILVDRHRGSIVVDSVPGRTTFRIRIPLTAS